MKHTFFRKAAALLVGAVTALSGSITALAAGIEQETLDPVGTYKQSDLAAGSTAIMADRIYAEPGEKVKVGIYIKNNPGYAASGIKLYYDPSLIPYIITEDGDAVPWSEEYGNGTDLRPETVAETYSTTAETPLLYDLYYTCSLDTDGHNFNIGTIGEKGKNNTVEEGYMVFTYFKVPEDAASGTKYPLKLNVDRFLDFKSEAIPFTTVDGWIQVLYSYPPEDDPSEDDDTPPNYWNPTGMNILSQCQVHEATRENMLGMLRESTAARSILPADFMAEQPSRYYPASDEELNQWYQRYYGEVPFDEEIVPMTGRVSFAAHDLAGEPVRIDLDNVKIVNQPGTLTIEKYTQDVYYVDPTAGGYSTEHPLVIRLQSDSSSAQAKIIVNNTVIHKDPSGYTSFEMLSDNMYYIPGCKDVIFFFEPDFKMEKFAIIPTGAYPMMHQQQAHSYTVTSFYDSETTTYYTDYSNIMLMNDPIWPTDPRWENLPSDLKYQYEMIPNATVFGERQTEFKFTNNCTIYANVIMPESAITLNASAWYLDTDFTFFDLADYSSDPPQINSPKQAHGAPLLIGGILLENLRAINPTVSAGLSDRNHPAPPVPAVPYTDEFSLTLSPLAYQGYDLNAPMADYTTTNDRVAIVSTLPEQTYLTIQAISAGTADITVTLTNGEVYLVHVTVTDSTATTSTATATTTATTTTTAAAYPAIIASGECGAQGDNLTWTLDSDGTLTISGEGEMEDWSSTSYVPWNDYREKIKKAVIENGATSIGRHAFTGCKSLTSITIPDGVTTIGDSAFFNCYYLTKVKMPDSVTSIEDHAFCQCTGLTEITIPDSVTSIGESAFYSCESLTGITIPDSMASIGKDAFEYCISLTEITIPDSVTGIGSGAFAGCSSLKSITVDTNNENYVSKDGVLFNKDFTALFQYPAGSEKTRYAIPDSVTSIGDAAFCQCTGLTEITIPGSVTSIGGDAFRFCTGLTEIKIPDSVTSIDSCTFYCCKGLSEFTIPDNVTSIGYMSFRGCTGLTEITIPDNITSIGDDAFWQCTNLNDIYIQNPECKIYNYSYTISDTAVIHGYSGSTAQAYAEKYNRTFVSLGDPPETGTTTTTTSTTTTTTTTSTTTTTTTTSTTTTTTSTTTTTTTSTTTTSTTTTTTTTTSATTTTSTTTTATSTTTTASVPRFLYGADNWGMPNEAKNFTTARGGYYLGEDMVSPGSAFQQFFMQLDNTERARVMGEMLRWKGSCWGMAVTSVLEAQGIIEAGQLAQDFKFLHSVTSENLTGETKFYINCYQMLQFTKPVSQRIRRFQKEYNNNDKAKSSLLIEAVESGLPTLLCYTYMDSEGYRNGHAVVAYDLEYIGRYSIPLNYDEGAESFVADVRIKIYNPNEESGLLTDKYDMYIKSDTGEWVIKMADDAAEYGKTAIRSKSSESKQHQAYVGQIGFICNDPEILNYRGIINGGNTLELLPDDGEGSDGAYYAALNVLNPSGESQINQAKSDPYDGSFYAENDKNAILYTADFFGQDDQKRLTAVVSGDRCYYVAANKPQPLDLNMEYEHCVLEASAGSAKRITVSPASRLVCEAVTGDYRLSMVQDEGFHPTDWYQLTVTGQDGGGITLTPEENGWLLKGDSLKNVTVTVSNDSNDASVSFSTQYNSVRIVEIDETTVGILTERTDGSEQMIAQTVHPLNGDVNADRSLSIADAVRLARLVSETDDGVFTAEENADVDSDGVITVFDLAALLDELQKTVL